MSHEFSDAFARLAAHTGIELPESLRRLYRDGKTAYGADWKSTWRQRMLEDPPALISVCDFEWNPPESVEHTQQEWLNPSAQNGLRFFPFGRSGAGDQYCLMPLEDGRCPVAYIWHDRPDSRIEYENFDDFVCSKLISTMADISHLTDDEFSPEQAQRCLVADLERTAACLNPESHALLSGLASSPLQERPYLYNPKLKPRPVWSLISQEDEERALERFALREPRTFTITPRWDIG